MAPESEADRRSVAPRTSLVGIPIEASGIGRWLPGLHVLRHYRRSWLARDIAAGLTLTALLVPAGMGYAEASGLPAITGLYATIVPLLAYALVGPSRILVLGPDSALVALVAAVVVPMSGGDPIRAVALGSMLSVLSGALCIVAGLARLGFLTDLLSKPVRVGYMNGIALTILVAQAPKLCGFSVDADGVADGLVAFVRGVIDGRTKLEALGIGAACLLIILGIKAIRPRVPGVLIAVVLATTAVAVLGFADRISVIGEVPRGLPLPSLPAIGLSDIGPLLVGATGTALVSAADTSVLSRTYAARAGERVDPNRELVGLGFANVVGGFFSGFPISSSASRTPVAEAAGSRTQLTGVVGALAIVVLLVAVPGLLSTLPTTALAAVVISAAIAMIDVASFRVFYRVRRSDFLLALVGFVAIAGLGVIRGIAIAVSIALLDFIRRAWRPHDAILGRAEGVKGYHDLKRYPNARVIPGLVLYRWDAPLFFANAETFRERLIEIVEEAATPVKWVVVAAEPITDVDTTAADMIQELDKVLASRGVELAFAEMKDPVKDRLHRYGLKTTIGADFFFPTLGVAVKAFLDRHQVDWVDWEEKGGEHAGE
ncbi:MAG: sulfate permease [Deltaproteobacteria bacterium]|nr:sulfate permease [Deltaproteobacteria bacterium]